MKGEKLARRKFYQINETKAWRITVKDFFPKALHPLHIFEEDEVLYAADLEKARIVELSVVMAEMLKFAETQDDQEISGLGNSYTDEISLRRLRGSRHFSGRGCSSIAARPQDKFRHRKSTAQVTCCYTGDRCRLIF